MKHKLLLALAAASALTACSTDQNSSKVVALKAENQLLKQQLAALGKDTADVLLKDLTAKAGMSDTAVTTSFNTGSTAASSTGSMWVVKHYVDSFGEPTKDGYISNARSIEGSFSNTATQNSPLVVMLLIDKDMKAGIQLYEYARTNPVKGSQGYIVQVKDSSGKLYRLFGYNHDTDRLSLEDKDATQFHAALLKGGKVQVVINESDTPTTEYHFTIDNADGYLEARKELKKG